MHQKYMKVALNLAREGLGRVAPNPSVGCVIVKDDVVLGVSRTADGGRPHAEPQAIEMAGDTVRGATAYVSLEPCAHYGKTGPCAEALVEAGIARCLIACRDPDPRVSGKGIDILKSAGIEVIEGVCETEALELNAGFFSKLQQNRPFITLKLAMSADHKIAAQVEQRTQISGGVAQRYTHHLRAIHDTVLVGAGTMSADDPMLNVRIDGYSSEITRIILDSNLRFPIDAKMVQKKINDPIWVFHAHDPQAKKVKLEEGGVTLFPIDPQDLSAVMTRCASEGITRVLVEGGAQIHRSFLENDMVDEFHLVRAKTVIGEQGVDAFDGYGYEDLQQRFGLQLSEKRPLGEDMLEIWRKED